MQAAVSFSLVDFTVTSVMQPYNGVISTL